jgi:hypothetical protein
MKMPVNSLPAGVGAALLAASLFGASTPIAKSLIGSIHPILLAGLLMRVPESALCSGFCSGA